MDRDTWMYKIKRNTIEYLREIDKFLECVSEDMRNRVHEHLFVLVKIVKTYGDLKITNK
jgi:hypothetical protein